MAHLHHHTRIYTHIYWQGAPKQIYIMHTARRPLPLAAVARTERESAAAVTKSTKIILAFSQQRRDGRILPHLFFLCATYRTVQ